MACKLLLSCEHEGRELPPGFAAIINRPEDRRLLESHRGWDPGISAVFRQAARELDCFALGMPWTRLLVDQNRSPHNPARYSEISRRIPPKELDAFEELYYIRYIEALKTQIEGIRQSGCTAFHFSFHSFTPRLGSDIRDYDLGILFDPAKESELKLAESLAEDCALHTGARIRFNLPYAGTDDGMCQLLRLRYPDRYCGFELEFNQQGLVPVISPEFGRLVDSVIGWLRKTVFEGLI